VYIEEIHFELRGMGCGSEAVVGGATAVAEVAVTAGFAVAFFVGFFLLEGAGIVVDVENEMEYSEMGESI
jgi:hypothetical protein